MAFVRWRGNCAQLLTTIYRDGRSQQLLLANLQGGYAVPLTRRAEITAAFPTVPIDWAAVDRALATGPPGEPPVSPRARTWAEVAHDLRDWALQAEAPSDRTALERAASVLTYWVANPPGPRDPVERA